MSVIKSFSVFLLDSETSVIKSFSIFSLLLARLLIESFDILTTGISLNFGLIDL